jgi:hypothetical protein
MFNVKNTVIDKFFINICDKINKHIVKIYNYVINYIYDNRNYLEVSDFPNEDDKYVQLVFEKTKKPMKVINYLFG